MRRKAEATERHPLPPSRRGRNGGPRELSITTLFRASQRVRSGEVPVPYLRISGRWLEQYGLTRGTASWSPASRGGSCSPWRRSQRVSDLQPISFAEASNPLHWAPS